MKYNYLYHIGSWAAMLLSLSACTDDLSISGNEESEKGDVINVGAGVDGLEVSSVVTRASGERQDAEKVNWLVQPLMNGLDITYGNISNGTHQNKRVAILKLVPAESGSDKPYKINAQSGYAEYSFMYRSDTNGDATNKPARWYDNGLHFFEGVHVPQRIRYSSSASELEQNKPNNDDIVFAAVNNLTTDQSQNVSTGDDNQLSNYYLLSHYLGMPANTQISATVARIKLPFRHRLARVLAYILIDPKLKTNGVDAKIEGYRNVETDSSKPFRDDPSTSSIRFCNVDVLEGVHDVYNETTKVHTLTPKWAEKVRKVIPHFVEQRASFKTYESEKKTWYEGTAGFPTSKPSGFEEVIYNNVPVYDLIVRPTYTSSDNVMYDEDRGSLTPYQYSLKKNQINFSVSLDNGLTYEKHFEFDLDANYQTIVYLKITRESVDYNESGSQLWVETTANDQWYGVDNQNGQTLSEAGSSWQRAYYNTALGSGDKITDGGFYDERTEGEDGTPGQYVTDTTWIKNFAQAYQGGAHHGDYFVLAKDITIDARSLPDDFVFTGHLDGFNTHGERQYHAITLTNLGTSWKEYVETTDYTSDITRYDSKPSDAHSNVEGNVFSLPDLYLFVEAVKYDEEECLTHNQTLPGYVTTATVKVPAVYYSEEDILTARTIVEAEGYVQGTNPVAEEVAPKTTADVKTPAIYYDEEEVLTINTALEGYWTTDTDKVPAHYELVQGLTLSQVAEGHYYSKSGEAYFVYTLPTLYKMTQHTSPSALFTGLNGIYSTKQEDEEAANRGIYNQGWEWEANVHKENGFWLPYRSGADATKDTGWRAEVMNLKVIGAKMFTDEAVITGNVQNCQYKIGEETTVVPDHIPAYPKYK